MLKYLDLDTLAALGFCLFAIFMLAFVYIGENCLSKIPFIKRMIDSCCGEDEEDEE